MKYSYYLIIFFSALALLAFLSEMKQKPSEQCAYDGTPIMPINKVVITMPNGINKQFCSVCCAGFWFDQHPTIEDDIEAGKGSITAVDEISGEVIDASIAYWIKSDQFSCRENKCRVHVYKEPGDAARHIWAYQGQEKPGYLAGLGPELPWAQPFTSKDVQGRPINLNNYLGQVVFLRFWNSGNPFTKEDLNNLAEAYQRWHEHGFVVLAVNVEQSEQSVKSFLQDLDLPFPIILDQKGELADLYGVKGYPTGFIVDKTGIIRNQSIGEIIPDMMEPLIYPLL